MNRPRDQLLARPALTAQQDRGVIVHQSPDKFVNLLHGRTAADDLAAHELPVDLILKPREVRGLGCDIDRTRDRRRYQIEILERFGQVIMRPALHRLDRIVHRARCCDDDDEACGLPAPAPRSVPRDRPPPAS